MTFIIAEAYSPLAAELSQSEDIGHLLAQFLNLEVYLGGRQHDKKRETNQ